MGLKAISFSCAFHEFICGVVQSPYTLRIVTLPYLDASSKTRLSNLGWALSPSTSNAILFIFSIKNIVKQSYVLYELLFKKIITLFEGDILKEYSSNFISIFTST